MSEERNPRETMPIDLPEVLERIGGDKALLQELIDIYIEDFVEKYALLEQAIEHNDFKTIQEIGHSLKGSSGNLSLGRLCRTSADIEISGKIADIEQARLHFIQLNQEFERLKNYLPTEKRKTIDQKWKGNRCDIMPAFSMETAAGDSGITVLAADDSVPNQVLIKFYATQAGFHIDIARNGREAVNFFRKKTYDIVLLDIHMPEIDGFEALNQMRQIESDNILPQTPIIALTGSTFQEEGTTCLDAGFDDFVEKSSMQEILASVIQKHVERARIQAEDIQLDKSIIPLVPGYLDNRKEDVQRILCALEEHNFNVIEDLGHKMKGSGKCYGFEKISMLGHRIEMYAKQKKIGEIEESVNQMQAFLSTLHYK